MNIGGVYAGSIGWLKEPLYPADHKQGRSGKPKVDDRNPDTILRIRPIIGLPLVTGFHYAAATYERARRVHSRAQGVPQQEESAVARVAVSLIVR